MDILYWIVIGLFLLFVLIGLKDGIRAFFHLWYSEGLLFAILSAIFLILFLAPGIVKQYAPGYYGLAVWSLILYAGSLLVYRFAFGKGDSD